MEGSLTISGNAKVTGGTAIEAKMGTITIADQAVITGTGTWSEDEPGNGGSSPEGSAILAAAQMYGASGQYVQYVDSPDLTVNVTGGTLKSTNGNTITVYNTEKTDVQTATVNVSGGDLTCGEGKSAVKSITTGGNTTSISGGNLVTAKGNTTVSVSASVAAAAVDQAGETSYYQDVDAALAANDNATADSPVEIIIYGSTEVTTTALTKENVILTVAKDISLTVTSAVESMNVLSTTNADGSTSYQLAKAGYYLVENYKGDRAQTEWIVPTSSEAGMVFAGWYTDESCETVYEPTEGVAYARFVKKTEVMNYLGGSLRMDYAKEDGTPDYSKTSLRFGYRITVPNDTELDSWNWNWGLTEQLEQTSKEGYYYISEESGIRSNLVVTNIPASSYMTDIYEQLTVNYITGEGTKVSVTEDGVQNYSVKTLAEKIAKEGTEEEKTYAQGLLNQLGQK